MTFYTSLALTRWQSLDRLITEHFYQPDLISLRNLLDPTQDDRSVQHGIPKVPFQKLLKMDPNLLAHHESCSICLVHFSPQEEVHPLSCGHVFHENCIQEWFKDRDTCPMCRQKMPPTTL